MFADFFGVNASNHSPFQAMGLRSWNVELEETPHAICMAFSPSRYNGREQCVQGGPLPTMYLEKRLGSDEF